LHKAKLSRRIRSIFEKEEKTMDFNGLTEIAKQKCSPRQLSKRSSAGSVAAALLTEHAAVAAMITAGENRIVKLVSVSAHDGIVAPCGRCREFINQIHDDNHLCEVMLRDKIVTLDDLLPERWE
jgi:cytidine deaminase